ncbi:MAG: site-2 protease family protein [Chloroflexi bacterium]|nr:site-2 protease family protein [Chloroflexota bacterium]
MDVLFRSVLPFVFIMVFLVVVHELGHFVTAKLAGVKVLEFGIGYPPRAWGFRKGETEYTLNILPLGGFVRLLGEEDPSDPRSLAAQKAWVRIIILVAGAVMNVLLPVLLFTIAYLVPQDFTIGPATVGAVQAGSPAEQAGVKQNDVLVSINGHKIDNTRDASYYIHLNQGKTMDWTVRRRLDSGGRGISAGSETIDLQVYARWTIKGPTGITIVMPQGQTESRSYPIWEAFPKGVRSTAESLILARNQVISWIKDRAAPEVSGPVGIGAATGDVVERAGWVALFEFAALLSINLAIINLLPLPMLDGGRVFFILIEILRGGKRVPPEKEALVHIAGFVVLLSLVVVISYFDILNIVNGNGALR